MTPRQRAAVVALLGVANLLIWAAAVAALCSLAERLFQQAVILTIIAILTVAADVKVALRWLF